MKSYFCFLNTDTLAIKDIISASLKNSMTYAEYRKLVKLAEEKSTTGNEKNGKTENLVEYTQLNDRRMRRWDKTAKIILRKVVGVY